MTCILELNDADLTLYRGNEVLYRSPGIAVVLGKDVFFGEDALRLSRIHPRQTNQQYFTRLNGDPLAIPGERARNHADLVYLHLLAFKPLIDAEGGEALLAVPGIWSADQLGVLLGVLQEAGIGVRGFVDSAVAATSTQEVAREAFFLDVMMQRAVITTLKVDAEVAKAGAQEVLECGLNRLLEGWINVVADRFVRETRFDPLHAAATEQQLFDQLYDWIHAGAQGSDLLVEIHHQEHTRRVELSRSLLEDKAEQRFRQLSDVLPRGAQVLLSARSARLPGLTRALTALHMQAVPLPGDALSRGCVDNLAHIVPADGELRLITRLPHGRAAQAARQPEEPEAPAETSQAAAASLPTHLLQGHHAWPLTAAELPLPVSQAESGFLLRAQPGTQLNGATLERDAPLQPGDRITVGGEEYLIIQVQD
ncbi:MAG: FHA domain-containing protein [Pseudomonadales bacterium]